MRKLRYNHAKFLGPIGGLAHLRERLSLFEQHFRRLGALRIPLEDSVEGLGGVWIILLLEENISDPILSARRVIGVAIQLDVIGIFLESQIGFSAHSVPGG